MLLTHSFPSIRFAQFMSPFLMAFIIFGFSSHRLDAQSRQTSNRKAPSNTQRTQKSSTRKNSGRQQNPQKVASKNTRTSTNSNRQRTTAAVVNGESITTSQLARECLRRYGDPVLESLVNKQLILQECQKCGITIKQSEVQAEIESIASKFNLSVDRWLVLLRDQRDITPDQYQRDIIWPTLALRRLVSDKLHVTQEEIDREFESDYGPKVQVRMIALGSRAKAEQILAHVKKTPKDFPKMAKNESIDANSAASRGMIPPIRKNMGDANIEKIAFGLKPGQISPIIKFAEQFIILRCERHIPATSISEQYLKDARSRLKDRIAERHLRVASVELSKKLEKESKVVNVRGDEKLSKTMPGVAALINGQKITTGRLAQECLKRHGIVVLDSMIHQKLLRQALARQGDKVEKQDLFAEIDRAALVYGHITKDGKPNRKTWIKEVEEKEGVSVDVYVDDAVWPSVALKKLVNDRVKVTQDDLQKGFEANYGPGVEVLAIVVSSQRVAQEVWDMARKNNSKAFFGELASQYSIEQISRSNMGEVPPIRKHSGQPLVEEEAFKLTPEDPLSGIVSVVGDRYIIMRYVRQIEPIVDDFDAVKDELHREIREKKIRLAMAKEFDRLKADAQIDNYLAGTTQSGAKASISSTRRNAPRQIVHPASTGGSTRQRGNTTSRTNTVQRNKNTRANR